MAKENDSEEDEKGETKVIEVKGLFGQRGLKIKPGLIIPSSGCRAVQSKATTCTKTLTEGITTPDRACLV